MASLFPTTYSLYPLFPQNKCTLGSTTFLYPTFLEMPFPRLHLFRQMRKDDCQSHQGGEAGCCQVHPRGSQWLHEVMESWRWNESGSKVMKSQVGGHPFNTAPRNRAEPPDDPRKYLLLPDKVGLKSMHVLFPWKPTLPRAFWDRQIITGPLGFVCVRVGCTTFETQVDGQVCFLEKQQRSGKKLAATPEKALAPWTFMNL